MRVALASFGSLALALVACQKSPPAPPPAPAPPAAKPAAPPDVTASIAGTSDPECVGPLTSAPPQTLSAGGRSWTIAGYKLVLDVPAGAPVTVGVVANADEASPENLAALGAYEAFFKANGAQVIVVDGDSGDTAAAIQGVLGSLAKGGVPVLAQIGNREPKGAFLAGVAAAAKEFPNVFNASRIREVDVGDVKLLTLPGYHDPRYLLAGKDGCLYHRDDVQALATLAKGLTGSLVLVSHGPPKGEGPAALDRVESPAANVGDPNLTTLLASAHIRFGIFANIIEAGGKATDLHGDKTIPPGTWASELYLNPGAGDTVSWAMNDGSHAKGMAAVLSFKGGQASHQILRLGGAAPAAAPAPTAAK